MFIHVSCNTLLNSTGSLLLDFDVVFILIFHFRMTSLIWCRGDITLMFPLYLKSQQLPSKKSKLFFAFGTMMSFSPSYIVLCSSIFCVCPYHKTKFKILNIFVTYCNALVLSTILLLGDHHILCNLVT